MRNLLIVAVLFLSANVFGQKATVMGKVTDKEMNNEALPFANVFIKGTTIGTTTDFDGNYVLSLDEGQHTVVFSFVGYTSEEQIINVEAGQTYTINQAVGASEGVGLDEVVVKAAVAKESVSALIAEQKKAVVIVESVGAQQLSSQGVSDAAAATSKVSGVSKQQGSSKVYVRGLGDRYNSTTLNGLPLPSNDPRLKNISLDLFSTDIIQNVGISKTFSSAIVGDFGGANINVVTKSPNSNGNIAVGVGTKFNSRTTFKDFKTIDGANYLGYASHVNHPITSLQKYSFTDSFSPHSTTAAPAISLSLNGGKKYNFDNGSSFSFFLVGAFDNSYRYKKGFSTNNKTEELVGNDYYDAREYDYATSKLLMGNFEFSFNPDHKLKFNSIYIQSNSQKIQDYFGDTNDNDNVNLILQTQNQNTLFVNQLISKNKLGDYVDLDLGLAYNTVANDEPNRMKNTFLIDPNTGLARFSTGSSRNNSRYYHNLKEDDYAVNLNTKIYLGERGAEDTKGSINVGLSARSTERDFKAIYFDHNIQDPSVVVDRNNLDAYFNQANLDLGNQTTNEGFRLITGYGFGRKALDPFTYGGTKLNLAGYASFDYSVTDDLFVSVGGRVESVNMDVDWSTNLTSGRTEKTSLNNNYFLPALNLKYSLNDQNQFRLSTSKTYTYPQFKEIAEFVYEGVDYTEQGNADLKPSENYNFDLKWEFFPEMGGIISATGFGKVIQNSISRIELVSAGPNSFSYANTGDASVFGVELEYKSTLVTLGDEDSENFDKLNLGFNTTLMKSNQQLEAKGLFNPTNSSAQLEGAAPVIVNTDLSYVLKNGKAESVATVVFNYQHDKLYSIGSNQGGEGLQNIVQKSITTLDFVGKHKFNDNLSLKLTVKNILDPAIERVRDLDQQLVNSSFKRGIDTGLSLTYKF